MIFRVSIILLDIIINDLIYYSKLNFYVEQKGIIVNMIDQNKI